MQHSNTQHTQKISAVENTLLRSSSYWLAGSLNFQLKAQMSKQQEQRFSCNLQQKGAFSLAKCFSNILRSYTNESRLQQNTLPSVSVSKSPENRSNHLAEWGWYKQLQLELVTCRAVLLSSEVSQELPPSLHPWWQASTHHKNWLLGSGSSESLPSGRGNWKIPWPPWRLVRKSEKENDGILPRTSQ